MAIRRFFANQNLNEHLEKRKASDREFGMQEAFTLLTRLYEADENTQGTTANTASKSVADIQKEVQNVEIPEVGIKLTGKADELYDQLVAKLQQSNLAAAVEILKTVATDDKLSKLLKHGFSTASGEETQIQVKVKPDQSLKTASLIPTQNVVVVSNSLDNLVNGYFMTKDDSGEKVPKNIDYTNYFTGDAPVPQPFVYQAGGQNYIIDGHHRWSQAYCMNPYGTVKCTVVTGPNISADTALKNFQAAIAVDEDKLPEGRGEGENLFNATQQSLDKTVAPMTEETASKIVTAGKDSEAFKNINQDFKKPFSGESENLQTAKALLVTNALKLKNTVTPGTNSREIMPQANTKKVTALLNNGAMPLAESADDPYGYGPYKNFSDPDIAVGDYVLTTRPFSRSGATYPARITSVTPEWIEYEISGFGFTDKGTKARPGSEADKIVRKAAIHLNSGHSEKSTGNAILQSSLTAEEKVDAWHAGTRRENYKAAGIPKLQTFLQIAKRKGYNDIVAIIEGELAKRGVVATTPSASNLTTPPSAPAASSTVTLTAPVSSTAEEPESIDPPTASAIPAVTLSEKDLDALLGMAIQKLGTCVLYARSVWKSAGGFVGSYQLTWRNSNGNPVKPDRAIDKVSDLAYDNDKLLALVSYFDGGSHNIDRYYSVDVPASTTYNVDRHEIYQQARKSYSYYDSDLNWKFYVLTKNKTNKKKVTMFILEKMPTLTPEQAEEITTKFFER